MNDWKELSVASKNKNIIYHNLKRKKNKLNILFIYQFKNIHSYFQTNQINIQIQIIFRQLNLSSYFYNIIPSEASSNQRKRIEVTI